MKIRNFFLCISLAILLAACMPPQTDRLRAQSSSLVHTSAQLDVPFFPQDDFQCGPASLASLLNFSGVEASPEQLRPEVYLPGRKGSFTVEMEASARRHGRLAYRVDSRVESVLMQLQAGRPVLVLLNLSLPLWPRWHFAVVTGFDATRQELLMHSGIQSGFRLSLPVFERTWVRAGSWGVMVINPRQLPADLPMERLLLSVRELERNNPVAAVEGYRALAARDDSRVEALFALGNRYRADGASALSENAFREALLRQPDYVPALNNLADLLISLGRAAEALPMAERAYALKPGEVTGATLAAARAKLAP